eukprot:2184810-Amphidinium_carterae.1
MPQPRVFTISSSNSHCCCTLSSLTLRLVRPVVESPACETLDQFLHKGSFTSWQNTQRSMLTESSTSEVDSRDSHNSEYAYRDHAEDSHASNVCATTDLKISKPHK